MGAPKEKDHLFNVLGRLKRFFFSSKDGKGEVLPMVQKMRVVLSLKGLFLLYHYFFKILKHSYLTFRQELSFRFLNPTKMDKERFLYYRWLRKQKLGERAAKVCANEAERLAYRPKISIVLILDQKADFYKQSFKSISEQLYKNYEVLVGLKSVPDEVYRFFKRKGAYVRIFDAESNGAIFNYLCKKATGEYVLHLEVGDTIEPHTLYEFANELQNGKVEVVYSDHDQIDAKGYFSSPYFKPDWSPDNFLSRNYIQNALILKRAMLKKVGGVHEQLNHAFLYDAVMKLADNAAVIKHISKVLLHTRETQEVNIQTYQEEKFVIEASLKRRNEDGVVLPLNSNPGNYSIRYAVKEKAKVSIIIPSKDQAKVLSNCLDSIFEYDAYTNFEVLVVNNNSTETGFFELLDKWKQREPSRFITLDFLEPFNYSRINNFASKAATGEYLLFLNNDTEVLTPDWLAGMVEQAQRATIGAVGVKLLFPNDTIQHAGVVLGLHGASGHSFLYEPKDAQGYKSYIQTITNYSALTAACLMVRKEVFESVEGFNEKYAVEFNDIDLCLRIRDLGLNNVYLPHVILYHFESLSRGNAYSNKKNFERYIKEKQRFKQEWKEYINNDPCYNPHLSKELTDFRLGLN